MRILEGELVVDTTATIATVVQDEFESTYTLPQIGSVARRPERRQGSRDLPAPSPLRASRSDRAHELASGRCAPGTGSLGPTPLAASTGRLAS